jgi:hypothetical protein
MSRPGVANARLASRIVLATPVFLALLSCASAPPESLLRDAKATRLAGGLRCESVIVSQEIQVPLQGNLADVRVTLRDVPETVGALRVLVRQPRFPALLELEGSPQPFDRVLTVQPERDLTVVLTRPKGQDDEWPRDYCKACRVEAELTGLFGAREGLQGFFARAMQDLIAVEGAFSRQSGEVVRGPELRELAESLSSESIRCGVSMKAPLAAAVAAVDQLDAARLHFYGSPSAELPDVQSVVKAFDAVQSALETQPLVADVARGSGWPPTMRHDNSRLHFSFLHLELSAQAALLPAIDRSLAAPWIALTLAPDAAALEKRIASLPRLQNLADAEARLAWVEARPGPLPLPGAAKPAFLRVRELRAVRHGKPCFAAGSAPAREGAAPAREGDALAVAQLLGADSSGRVPINRADDIPAARETLRRSAELLCEPPQTDVAPLFAQLAAKELGPVTTALTGLLREAREVPADSIARSIQDQTGKLLCALFDQRTIERRASTLAGYKVFVEGGAGILDLVPDLTCDGKPVTAAEVRQRLRAAYRDALDRHAAGEKLCPQRGGKCPAEVAESVRRLFSLQAPALASPAQETSRALDFPPPFGFSEAWVHRLGRCAREACAELSALRASAPSGQFEGETCAPIPDADAPMTVAIERPESPTSLTLTCEGQTRVSLLRRADAGSLVTIASPQPFQFGSQRVSRQGRHPLLGRIYERVADLNDPAEVARDGGILLTPTVEGQVFYFVSLRRRD